MGTWALHSFGNDEAADLLGDLTDQDAFSPVQEAIARVIDTEGYLEAPESQQCIAACEVVAMALGRPSAAGQAEDKLVMWLARVQPAPTSDMVSQAVTAIGRILVPESELLELWQESEEFGSWISDVTGLRSRLQA